MGRFSEGVGKASEGAEEALEEAGRTSEGIGRASEELGGPQRGTKGRGSLRPREEGGTGRHVWMA